MEISFWQYMAKIRHEPQLPPDLTKYNGVGRAANSCKLRGETGSFILYGIEGEGRAMMDPQTYMVSSYEPEGTSETLVFTFVPKDRPQERGLGGAPKRAPRFVVGVRLGLAGLDFDWSDSPDNPGVAGADIQAEITTRIRERAVWIGRVNELVAIVENWAKELGWATRRIEKKLDDARVGKHRVPALLMQADTCRIMLEPVGRSRQGLRV